MRKLVIVLGIALLLNACNASRNGTPMEKAKMYSTIGVPVAPVVSNAADAAPNLDKPEALKPVATQSRIAYSYSLGYTLADQNISGAQAKHMALCDALGKAHCQIAKMERESRDGETATALLELRVDAGLAKAFEDQLNTAVGEAGGSNASRSIEATDLTKDMTDTDAKIKAKQALADRLLGIIQHHNGKVGDLVEAEKAFSDAQEELDAARNSMAQMQGRVAMTDIHINYSSTTPAGSGFWHPVRDAFTSVGQTLGTSVALLLSAAVAMLPWLLGIWGFLWCKRRLGWSTGIRWPWRPRVASVQASAAP